MRRIALAAVAVLLAACAPKPETPEQTAARMKAEADTVRLAIDAQNARLVRFTAAGQADSTAAVYAEDAVFFGSNAPAVRGRAAIASMFRSMLATGTFAMTPKTLSVEANGPIAIETGSNVIAFTPGPKAPRGTTAYTDTIKYVTTWRNVGGQWLISNDIGTTDRPAQPAKR